MLKDKKIELRKKFLENRINAEEGLKQSLSEQIFKMFFENVAIKDSLTIAGYFPVRGEVDVVPILKELINKGCKCVLPRVKDTSSPLSFLHWDENTEMRESGLKIPEPVNGKGVVPDIIIAPLVAFDPRGYRLGYGSGLYDRTLEVMNETLPVFTVGVGYEFQKCDEIPIEKLDVPMDMIITESQVYI